MWELKEGGGTVTCCLLDMRVSCAHELAAATVTQTTPVYEQANEIRSVFRQTAPSELSGLKKK